MKPQYSTTCVEASTPSVTPACQAYQEHLFVGDTTQNSVEFQPVLELVKVQEIPELQFLERIQEQTEEQVVDVPAPPIVDDTAETHVVEGVKGIPQEPFPEEIEEQFGPVFVPQSMCHVAPTPVIYVAHPVPRPMPRPLRLLQHCQCLNT